MIRSLIAVVLGYLGYTLATIGLWLASGHRLHEVPSDPFLLFSFGCEIAFALASGYLTALVAGRNESGHSLALAAVMVLQGVVTLPAAPGQLPFWVPLSTILVLAPCCYLGGRLRERRKLRKGFGTTVEAST